MKSLAIACNLVLAGVIFWLGLSPLPPNEIPLPSNDKVGHALAFFAVGVAHYWLYFTLRSEPRGAGKARLGAGLATFTATGLGGALELLQMLVPSRQAEFGDLVADFIGAAVGAALMYLLVR